MCIGKCKQQTDKTINISSANITIHNGIDMSFIVQYNYTIKQILNINHNKSEDRITVTKITFLLLLLLPCMRATLDTIYSRLMLAYAS